MVLVKGRVSLFLNGVQVVAGSNPVAPTSDEKPPRAERPGGGGSPPPEKREHSQTRQNEF